MDRKCAFLSKTRTFLSDPKLLDCSVYFIVFTVQLYDSCVSLCCAKSAECSPSMVVHTSVPFGVKHLEEAKEQVEPIILVKLNKPLPGLPQPDNIKCQKWRYSLVTSSVADCPGQMTLLPQPLLVCGGDGFTHSNFDGCIESALKMFDVLKSSF
uniref:Renalase, FAD-dependent amine oxidase n=1 Tax=Hucho hucho TaxID=62062 RepID=A0A4W5MNP0_9TELE